jgi:hypothetical protein
MHYRLFTGISSATISMCVKNIFLLVFLMVIQNLYSIDLRITGDKLELCFAPEYNRTSNFCWNFSTSGSVYLNDMHTIKTGFEIGAAGNILDIRQFVGGEMRLPVRIPLYISLAYNYNSIKKYEYHVHSLPLLIHYKTKRLGAALGTNFRLTSQFKQPLIFEPVLSYLFFINIINNDILKFGFKVTNFDDFAYDNYGAYYLNMNTNVKLNKKLSLVNEIEYHQSGSFSVPSNFYRFVYRGGVQLSW